MATEVGTPAEQPAAAGVAQAPNYGERAVGLTFNPSGDAEVHKLKMLYAEIINILDRKRSAEAGPSEKGRVLSVAITEAQTAQMWAVKGITYTN
jgi:hypothetical protein